MTAPSQRERERLLAQGDSRDESGGTLFNGFGEGCGRYYITRDNAHGFPVIWELFAAIETHDVRTRGLRCARTALTGPGGDRETVVFVPAAKEDVREFCQHNLPPENNPNQKAEFLFLAIRFRNPGFGFV
jgi:hypothetical protein